MKRTSVAKQECMYCAESNYVIIMYYFQEHPGMVVVWRDSRLSSSFCSTIRLLLEMLLRRVEGEEEISEAPQMRYVRPAQNSFFQHL